MLSEEQRVDPVSCEQPVVVLVIASAASFQMIRVVAVVADDLVKAEGFVVHDARRTDTLPFAPLGILGGPYQQFQPNPFAAILFDLVEEFINAMFDTINYQPYPQM
jgi:hypothetical protein